MTMKFGFGLLAMGVFAASGVHAQEIAGGELRFGFERFINEDSAIPGPGDADGKLSMEGSLELGFGAAAAQLDLTLDRYGIYDERGEGGVLHGIYNLPNGAAVGGFYGVEKNDVSDFSFYGIEGAMEMAGYGVEGWLMHAENDDADIDGTIVGIEGGYDLRDFWRTGAKVVYGEFDDDENLSRYALTNEFRFSENATFTTEFGRFDNDAPGSADIEGTYVAFMTTFSFGPGRDTTFGRRGVVDLLPGF